MRVLVSCYITEPGDDVIVLLIAVAGEVVLAQEAYGIVPAPVLELEVVLLGSGGVQTPLGSSSLPLAMFIWMFSLPRLSSMS